MEQDVSGETPVGGPPLSGPAVVVPCQGLLLLVFIARPGDATRKRVTSQQVLAPAICDGPRAARVHTMEDLAEQAVDDLLDIEGLEEERAAQLIMTARAPWFEGEEAGE